MHFHGLKPYMYACQFMLLSLAMLNTTHAAIEGIYFEHQDWEIACDNTGTCRAAGYQSDSNFEKPVSVLLERAAGKNSAIHIKLNIAPELENTTIPLLYIQQQSYGLVTRVKDHFILNEYQSQALLKAIQGTQKVQFKLGDQFWELSNHGANAVLLKMDEFQKRIGTRSAILRKGQQSNKGVLIPQPIPQVWIKKYQASPLTQLKSNTPQAQKLISQLKKTTNTEECSLLFDQGYLQDQILTLYPINQDYIVVEIPCWQAAYNSGNGYWLISRNLNQIKQKITTSADSFSEAQIFDVHKGRGIADCISHDEWAWNGTKFVTTYRQMSGQCKGFVGGAWHLPLHISKVDRAS